MATETKWVVRCRACNNPLTLHVGFCVPGWCPHCRRSLTNKDVKVAQEQVVTRPSSGVISPDDGRVKHAADPRLRHGHDPRPKHRSRGRGKMG